VYVSKIYYLALIINMSTLP